MEDLFKDDYQILEEESYECFLNRFRGFGKELYTDMKLEIPLIFKNLKLYKAIKLRKEYNGLHLQDLDSYAHYFSEEIIFRIYIDPESEVIGIHNYNLLFETGFWSEIPTKEIINFIKKEITPIVEL
ncbi:hypothetical protein [Tenacibaculum finnmarkense]|uniref:hypothetical protein n=1 Tax=Tenacibaculum finnmarkense TaxID=2781243 RepID=UPI001E428351|nr:hypothetical protein [Tenacibaculum finnmarkense]MCD8412054.1 hypothetical protein [Tenacibaculum finnmarkense genomovar ulcerans]